MSLTLQNFSSEIPASFIKKAVKLSVRECDEEEPGKFIAFVDDKDASYDVSIEIRNGKEIISHHCDCDSKKEICSHKVALIQHLAGLKKKAPGKKIPKKDQKFYDLLDDADAEKLRLWIRQVLEKNKDLRLSLESFLSGQKNSYTTEEVRNLTMEATKTVIGRKRTADATQIKKIVELWETVHKPVIEYVRDHMPAPESFAAFNALVFSCLEFRSDIHARTDRISKYLEKITYPMAELIAGIENEEHCANMVNNIEQAIQLPGYTLNIHYLNMLESIYQLSNSLRKKQLAEILVNRLTEKHLKSNHGGDYGLLLLHWLKENGLFKTYSGFFIPLHYKNEYNLKLIDLLIDHDFSERAEKYCHEQVKYNIHDEFSVPYWHRLQNIYRRSNNKTRLRALTKDMLPFTFNFDDYQYVMKDLNEEEAKKFRRFIMGRAKNSFYSNEEAEKFYFRLLDHEGRVRKMLEMISNNTRTEVIVQYFERMAFEDKDILMHALVMRHQKNYHFMNNDKMEADLEVLPGIIPKYYSLSDIQKVLRNYTQNINRGNPFLGMLHSLVEDGRLAS